MDGGSICITSYSQTTLHLLTHTLLMAKQVFSYGQLQRIFCRIMLHKAIQKHTGSQHEFAASVAEQKIRSFVQGWTRLIRRLERNQLYVKVPAPEWQEIIISVIPHTKTAAQTVFRPAVSTLRKESLLAKGAEGDDSGELATMRTAFSGAHQISMLQAPSTSLPQHITDKSREAGEVASNVLKAEEHPSGVADQSRTFSSLE